jgi:predicted outer membrane repeat protein
MKDRSPQGAPRMGWEVSAARLALLVFAGVVALALALAPESTLAATADVGCGDVPGLKAAITTAAAGDTISLGAGCTYTLTAADNTDAAFGDNGLPLINKELTIEGNNATITRAAGPTPNFRIFDVAVATKLTIDRLTVSNGSLNGAHGGAVLVKSAAKLTITNTTFLGNVATIGGAIASDGTVLVTGTTFVGNGSTNVGGALFIGTSGLLDVANSTFTGNATTFAGGAIHNSASEAMVASSTFSGNTATIEGGAIFNGRTGSLTVLNSVLADNSGGNCGIVIPVTDGGHNISWPDTTCPGVNADPRLGPLASNGGPTQTLALLPASPAIDALPRVGAGCPATDQRGVSRPQGPNCDIGAFELSLSPTPSPTPAPTSTPPQVQAPVPSPPATGGRPASDVALAAALTAP